MEVVLANSYYVLYVYMATHGNVWLCMAMYGYICQCMAMYGNVWLYVAMYGYVWLYMAMSGNVWQCMTMYVCMYVRMYVCMYVCTTILQHRLRWVGHIARTLPTRLPKTILYGELADGKRPRGGPKRRFKDQMKRSLAQANIPANNWEPIALERHSWKVRVREGVEAFEAERRSQMDLKRQKRKRRQAATPPPATLPSDYCPRLSRHRLGLLSHVRAHKRHQKDS